MRVSPANTSLLLDDVAQLLDEHHLAIVCNDRLHRHSLVKTLRESLSCAAQTEVIAIDGSQTVDLPTFIEEMKHSLAFPRAADQFGDRSPLNLGTLISALRTADRGVHYRYFIWREAHIMLQADVRLFSRIVNAMLSVAAECEHVSLDPVILQRVIFIGGNKLGAYADDHNAQFRKWLDDEPESLFWEVASVLEHPAVLTYRIDG